MKILGTVGQHNLLVEMTPRELARVSGLGSYEDSLRPENRYGGHRTGLEPGTVYEVGAAWDRLQEQAMAATKLEGVSKTLTALADLVMQTKVQFTQCTEKPAEVEAKA